MGYEAVKGGHEAIENACRLFVYERVKNVKTPIKVEQIKDELYLLVDRVMSEASLYAPQLAALAIKQAAGDCFEAVFLLRAYRTTLPRLGYSLPIDTRNMRVIRRISAAFKEIPGGQILGPTSDYTLRLLDFTLFNENKKTINKFINEFLSELDLDVEEFPMNFPKIVDILRNEGLLVENFEGDRTFSDITKQPIIFPAKRCEVLQAMSRGETGGLLLLAYSNMRGYGDIHPTIGELRVGYVPVYIKENLLSGEVISIGEIKVTEAEIIAKFEKQEGKPSFTLGYGLCFGHNEIKAISMAVLDRAMQSKNPQMISENQEFVLAHIDGVESMGFCNHYKLPHYVTFQSDLDRLRKAQKEYKERHK
ncbi:MAG: carbon-phosphorus lyase complex subunit PhnI [Caldimicrobium sp.]|nr:carbon-phosphorus lyase complex subunit PhnI [Caldimicrobium sp.]MCX7874242.1 carbon-phosphorus lyase complex subunit PhnI [Caldimicrobium sp.]MDW8094771.1 carbon-phosphorus lyase complex subunit PhnI [Caldimicrobium sp.]